MKTVRSKCRLLLLCCLLIGSTFTLLLEHHDDESSLPPINDDLQSNNGKMELSVGSFGLTIHNETYDYRYSSKLPLMSQGSNNAKSKPTIVFGILSTPNNLAARQAIRDSWGKEEALFFVLGGEYTSNIDLELRTFHDIVFLEAPEDYRSGLTRKSMLIIHFYHYVYNVHCKAEDRVTSTCYHYLFKTDDDSYVNTTQLRLEISGKDPKTQEPIAFYGEPSIKTEPDRNASSRFYISYEEYPRKVYPPYAFGMGYALSSPLVACACHKMVKVRKQPPWEDVATGALVRKCGFKLTWANWSLPGRPQYQNQDFPYETLKSGGFSVTVVHGVKNPDWMKLLHRQQPLP
mmetsp:Transcript_32993/g.79799  ORF Transcript_32993/g.79799 Transcript_32993/m.79799 type:complete len:346 (-) Transcript_32993:142-1179(-)